VWAFVAVLLGMFTFAVACILLIGVVVDVLEKWRRGEF
jgi:hypothetical protein